MMSASSKYWSSLIGFSLSVAGVIFVTMRLHAYLSEIDLSLLSVRDLVTLALLFCFYGATNILLARAWWLHIAFFNVNTSWRWALKVYGISQLAKYLPGNIFHLAGRQALGVAKGLPVGPLAKSSALELGSIVVSGGVFTVLLLPFVWPQVGGLLASVIFVVTLAVLYRSLIRFVGNPVAHALLWQVSFLALSGLIFTIVLLLVADISLSLWLVPSLCGAYIVAWLVGLITPGAPAGLGIRELVIIFLLNSLFSEADLLLAVVLGRAVTVLGDMGFYFFALILPDKEADFA